MVYLNGELLGLAEKYLTKCESDEDDPGHTAPMISPAGIGVEEIEFIVINGTESVSAYVDIS